MNRRISWVAAGAIATALALTGCGGGGGGTTPASSGGSASKTVVKQPLPPAAGRTSVGSAHLTLVLPQIVHATSGQAVRALLPPASSKRHGLFVDPSPAPGVGPCQANVLDIYVDGSLEPALDNGEEAPDSWCVVSTPDGTQNVNIPLYSTALNQVVVVEWDPTVSNILAIGEANQGGFSPGSSNIPLTVTLQMNAENIGITNLSFSNPEVMYGQTYTLGSCALPNSTPFGVYEADWEGNFVPAAGYGGVATPSLSGNSKGASNITQSTTGGIWIFNVDPSGYAVNVSASAANPAWSIYNDITNANFWSYYDGYYGNYTGGANQGIFNLWYFYSDTLNSGIYQFDNQTLNEGVTLAPQYDC